jgi:hypothetical protein
MRLRGVAGLGPVQYQGSRAASVVRHAVRAAPRLGRLLPYAGWQSEANTKERSRAWLAGIDVVSETVPHRALLPLSGGISARLTDYDEPDSATGTWTRSGRGRLIQTLLNYSPAPTLSFEARAAHQGRRFDRQAQDDWDQLLGSVRAALTPWAGLRVLSDLSQSFRRVQLRDEFFRYVGPAQGEFRRDSATGRYVADPKGDYERILIATGRTAAARTLSASGSGEVSLFRPLALTGSVSSDRTGTESGTLSSHIYWDLRLAARALTSRLTPVLGTSHRSSHDRTLAATGLAQRRTAGYVELSSDLIPEIELRMRTEASRALRVQNSGLLDHDELGGRTELNPVVGKGLRLEFSLSFERRVIAQPVAYPELGRFTLDAWRTGLARSITIGRKTRVRSSVELVRRTASVSYLPFELSLSDPLGLSPALGIEFGHSFSNVLSASARYGFTNRPDRPAEHQFGSELRAEF